MNVRRIVLPVHGTWMSIYDVAEIFGLSYAAVYKYRVNHKDADGRPMSLEAVYDHYAAVRRGDIPVRPGIKPRLHRCAGKLRSVKQAAEALGCSVDNVYQHMYYHHCTLDEAWRRIEDARARRAHNTILRILKGG